MHKCIFDLVFRTTVKVMVGFFGAEQRRCADAPHSAHLASAAARAAGAGSMDCLVEATPAVREALRRANEAAGGQWEVRRRSGRRDNGATRLVTAEAAGRAMAAMAPPLPPLHLPVHPIPPTLGCVRIRALTRRGGGSRRCRRRRTAATSCARGRSRRRALRCARRATTARTCTWSPAARTCTCRRRTPTSRRRRPERRRRRACPKSEGQARAVARARQRLHMAPPVSF